MRRSLSLSLGQSKRRWTSDGRFTAHAGERGSTSSNYRLVPHSGGHGGVSSLVRRSSTCLSDGNRNIDIAGASWKGRKHRHQETIWPSTMRPFNTSEASTTFDEQLETSSWNDRAGSFLERWGTLNVNTLHSIPNDQVAQTLGELLTGLLQITSAKFQKGSNHAIASTSDEKVYPEDTFSWDFLGLGHLSGSDGAGEMATPKSATEALEAQEIDVGLVFSLLELLVKMEQHQGSSHTSHISDWTVLSNCLNPILQLWKHEYSKSRTSRSSFTKADSASPTSIPTPSQVLSKLDHFRENSNMLLPDVRSYNILLEAVATAPIARRPQRQIIDISFCQNLWSWMLKEAKHDSLLRPDIVTLRTLFKAHVTTGHEQAPQRCEALMEEWLQQHNVEMDTPSSVLSYSRQQQLANGVLSMIHVWATYDPQVAESYLKRLADNFVSGTTHVPPDTIAWNRVISAYAIVHSKPEDGHRVLEDFWQFYQRVHNLSSDLSISNASQDSLSSSSNAWKVGAPNLSSYNAVLEGYAVQENATEANKIFSRLEMSSSTKPSIGTYTSLIKANGGDLEIINGFAKKCINAWKELVQNENAPDHSSPNDQLIVDHAFFHAWLKACVRAGDVAIAKTVLKFLKACQLDPNSTTYLLFLDVFLERGEPQAAIEWLLAYAKFEGLTESDIVAWTIRVLEWYRKEGSRLQDVDPMVFLQVLCENEFITSDDAVGRLLSHIAAEQGMAILDWIPGNKESRFKSRAIVMRKLAQDPANTDAVEKMFLEWRGQYLRDQKSLNTKSPSADDRKVLEDMCTSVISVWARRNNMRKVRSWINIIAGSPILPPLSRVAQMNIVQAYCRIREPHRAEEFVLEMEESLNDADTDYHPDAIMKNVVLKAWANEGNGNRAAAFLKDHISDPDIIAHNAVIHSFCRQGAMDQAEKWASNLIKMFLDNPVESRRPDNGTFVILLSAWRQSRDPIAAVRSEKVLRLMHELFDKGVILERPNRKSYEVLLDTLEKSPLSDAGDRALALLSSSPFRNDMQMMDKVRRIQAKFINRETRSRRLDKSVATDHKENQTHHRTNLQKIQTVELNDTV